MIRYQLIVNYNQINHYYLTVYFYNNHTIMNQPIKVKRPLKMVQNTTDIYLQNRNRTRYSIHNANNPTRNDLETIRSYTKKSIEGHIINHPKHTINVPSPHPNNQKVYFKRNTNLRRQLARRYDQQETGLSKSPYLRKQILNSRTSSLNRSNQKIKSSHLVKQTSPHQLYGLKQPHSSLSQHYDQEHTITHKRRGSVVASEQKNYVLEEVKELFKNNQFPKAIELLKKFLRVYNNHAQAKYLLGMSYINSNDFNVGIQQLLESLNIDPTFKKSLYLVLALAYRKLNKIQQGIQILTNCLNYFPDYYDCYVYRAKLLYKTGKYQQASTNFNNAIKLNPSKGFPYIGKGNCLKQLGRVKQALNVYAEGTNTDSKFACYQKKAKCLFDLGRFEQALKDYQKCTQLDFNYIPAYYYKGIILYKLKKNTEAILNLEQCLKNDSDRSNLTSAVQTLIKIKIEDKDFYEAYHILNRSQNIDVYRDVIDDWKIFIEASLSLMKKKCKEAVTAFKSLLNKSIFKTNYSQLTIEQQQRYSFIKPLIHLYKGYGELAEGQKINAKLQYQAYDQACKQLNLPPNNVSKSYNLLIIQAGENFPKNSLRYIQKANKLLPTKPQPYLYLAINKVANAPCSSRHKYLSNQIVEQIVKDLTEGISHLPQLSNNHISSFFYLRAIIYLHNNQFNKAVPDIDKAIEKSEDNIPKYFYLRGLIFACFGNFSQAVQDFSVSINLDEKYAKPFLERAKCLQIEGNSNDAFMDLQKYITLSPEDKMIHKYAGFLLFQNCAYQDCLSAFSHGIQEQPDLQIICTKAKCNFLLGNFQTAINLLEEYQQIDQSQQYQIDIKVISICNQLGMQISQSKLQKMKENISKIFQQQKENNGKIFKLRDIYQLRSSINLILREYEVALMDLNHTLQYFKKQKQQELSKQFIDDIDQFEDEWSEIEIKYNMALCYIGLNMPEAAKNQLKDFQKNQQKGKNWEEFLELIDEFIDGKNNINMRQLQTFQQNHRLSKKWPKINLNNLQISLAFSYPFVQPPQLLPEFDEDLFLQFDIKKIENKPEAPWINRNQSGLVFTPNIQVFDQLELSMTTNRQNLLESDNNKIGSIANNSSNLSQSDVFLEGEELKKKFKLDSQVEMKLKKLMKK